MILAIVGFIVGIILGGCVVGKLLIDFIGGAIEAIWKAWP